MNTQMSRRAMLTSVLPAAAIATATGPAAVASTTTNQSRPASRIRTRRREFWDSAAEWVATYEEVVCCTAAERDALIASRPEAATWSWLDFGDRHVGISPRRPGPHWTGDGRQDMRMYLARLEEVQDRRLADA